MSRLDIDKCYVTVIVGILVCIIVLIIRDISFESKKHTIAAALPVNQEYVEQIEYPQHRLFITHDDKRHTTCYITGNNISCVPDSK